VADYLQRDDGTGAHLPPVRRTPGQHVSGADGAMVLDWLHRERVFGLAADVTVDTAREHPGRVCYTPDGACWVRYAGEGTWLAGDSADAEMRLAHDRRRPVRTRIDPDAIEAGDTVTYLAVEGRREYTGRAEYGTAGALHVTRDRLTWTVEWDRLTGHTPQGAGRAV